MKLRDNQTFLSLYYEPNAVEIATGEADSFASVESWQRETKQLGQVATPEPIAALMAKWVMSAKPRTVLDPAAGRHGLPQVGDLLAQAGDLVDEILFGAVLVAHVRD